MSTLTAFSLGFVAAIVAAGLFAVFLLRCLRGLDLDGGPEDPDDSRDLPLADSTRRDPESWGAE